MSQRRIELIETAPGVYTAIEGPNFADRLQRDEALGVLAAWIFQDRAKPLPYLRDYTYWVTWRQRYCEDSPTQPVALLGCNYRINQSPILQRREFSMR